MTCRMPPASGRGPIVSSCTRLIGVEPAVLCDATLGERRGWVSWHTGHCSMKALTSFVRPGQLPNWLTTRSAVALMPRCPIIPPWQAAMCSWWTESISAALRCTIRLRASAPIRPQQAGEGWIQGHYTEDHGHEREHGGHNYGRLEHRPRPDGKIHPVEGYDGEAQAQSHHTQVWDAHIRNINPGLCSDNTRNPGGGD
ncbi:hypothetical protein J8273_0028 [Carpediemonas membranifera]|uniref:Uncharacterized protein n=1 Tax=Carpediemonas membranifera TaxID=201153 RepID=A0A8J6E2L2_9EUKA|nr:hypothetical protein J8273_0028 [Carpediemonas membranifera]|eukprot:KAG9394823.1 hypothetical protein J8273_0028 [Carpediemonas membranifera]